MNQRNPQIHANVSEIHCKSVAVADALDVQTVNQVPMSTVEVKKVVAVVVQEEEEVDLYKSKKKKRREKRKRILPEETIEGRIVSIFCLN